MKKQYNVPATKVVALSVERFIATSDPSLNNGYGQQNGPRLGKEEDFDEGFGW